MDAGLWLPHRKLCFGDSLAATGACEWQPKPHSTAPTAMQPISVRAGERGSLLSTSLLPQHAGPPGTASAEHAQTTMNGTILRTAVCVPYGTDASAPSRLPDLSRYLPLTLSNYPMTAVWHVQCSVQGSHVRLLTFRQPPTVLIYTTCTPRSVPRHRSPRPSSIYVH